MSDIREILKTLQVDTVTSEYSTMYMDLIDKAEQALLALFDEAIGENEPEYNPAPWSAGTHELELKYQVRRELRTATLQKYAAFMDIDLAGQPITPLQAAKITKLLIQQVVQSIDNIHQTAGQQA